MSAVQATTKPLSHPAQVPLANNRKEIDIIITPPGLHWVGNGFRVAGYFSAIPSAVKRLSPFLLLDYNPPHNYPPTTEPRGVGVHPHRGFETVTIAWEGSVAHHDSTGAGGVIGPGDVQWMTAASGILHKEYHEEAFARRGGTFHMAQLWVNLPRAHKMSEPRYQPLSAEQMGEVELALGAGKVRVIAGEYQGVAGPAKTFTPINLFDVRLNPQGKAVFSFPAHQNTSILVMQGEVKVGQRVARANDFVLFKNAGEAFEVEANEAAHLMVLNGEPIDEPVVQYGPFVMNTQQEIQAAFRDYTLGKFGSLDD